MKGLFSILTIILCIIFVACSGDQPKTNDNSKPESMVKKVDPPKDQNEPEKNKPEPEKEPEPEPEPEKEPELTVDPEQLKKAEEILAKVTDDQIAEVDAKSTYKTLCAACHGFTGNLNINGAKDLTKSKISLAEAVAQVYHGKGLMTPFKEIMSDAEIVAVSKYVEDELVKK